MKWFLVLGLGVVSALSMGANLTYIGLQGGKYTDVHIKYNSNAKHVYAGTMSGSLDGGAAFDMYCVDLDHVVSTGNSFEVDVLDESYLSNGTLAGRLFNMFNSGVDSSIKGAALQLSIWDAVVDGGDGFASGNLQEDGVGASILAMANGYLTSALSSASSGAATYLRAQSHPDDRNQNMITGEPVPEPASMVAMILGAAGVLKRRRKA